MKTFTENVHSFITDEGEAKITLMKPSSGEHEGMLIWMHQDAYGDFNSGISKLSDLLERFPKLCLVRPQILEIMGGILFLSPTKK